MSFALGHNCSEIGGKEISRTSPLCKPSTMLFGVMWLVRFEVNKDAKDMNRKIEENQIEGKKTMQCKKVMLFILIIGCYIILLQKIF